MANISLDKIDLGTDAAAFEAAASLDLWQLAEAGLVPGRGGPASVRTLQRYANPKGGCRPLGPDGPRLVLPTVLVGGRRRTMRAWALAFARQMVRLGGFIPGSDAGGA